MNKSIERNIFELIELPFKWLKMRIDFQVKVDVFSFDKIEYVTECKEKRAH